MSSPMPVFGPLSALSHDKRLLVAERLAVGDPEVLAGSIAGIDEDQVVELKHDPSFLRLIQACRGIQQLARADWRLRTEALLRGAAERAMAEGRVSTVNLILRQSFVLDPSYDEEEKQPDWVTQGVLTGYRLKDIETYDHDGLLDLLAIKEGPEAYERRMEQKRSRAAEAVPAPVAPEPPVAVPESPRPELTPEPEPDVATLAPVSLPDSPQPVFEPWPFKDEPTPEQRAREPRPRQPRPEAPQPPFLRPAAEPVPGWYAESFGRGGNWYRARAP